MVTRVEHFFSGINYAINDVFIFNVPWRSMRNGITSSCNIKLISTSEDGKACDQAIDGLHNVVVKNGMSNIPFLCHLIHKCHMSFRSHGLTAMFRIMTLLFYNVLCTLSFCLFCLFEAGY